MSEIVINTSPWIALSIINLTTLLPKIYKEIYIPEDVVDEILDDKSKVYGKEEILKSKWLKKVKYKKYFYKESLITDLDKGEISVILVALELNIKNVLIDETIGRKMATLQGLKPIGTIGLLAQAKNMKLIEKVKPYIIELIHNGIWLSSNFVNQILKELNE